jgi:hypothetical protein
MQSNLFPPIILPAWKHSNLLRGSGMLMSVQVDACESRRNPDSGAKKVLGCSFTNRSYYRLFLIPSATVAVGAHAIVITTLGMYSQVHHVKCLPKKKSPRAIEKRRRIRYVWLGLFQAIYMFCYISVLMCSSSWIWRGVHGYDGAGDVR